MRGRRDVQRRVTAVDVVTDRIEEVRLGVLAGSPDPDRTRCEITCRVEPSRNVDVVTGRDRTEEREQRTVVGPVGWPTCFRHPCSLPATPRGATMLCDGNLSEC